MNKHGDFKSVDSKTEMAIKLHWHIFNEELTTGYLLTGSQRCKDQIRLEAGFWAWQFRKVENFQAVREAFKEWFVNHHDMPTFADIFLRMPKIEQMRIWPKGFKYSWANVGAVRPILTLPDFTEEAPN